MPLPIPHQDEKEDEFIARCMGSEAAKEFGDDKQRLAVCYSQFRRKDEAKGERYMDILATVEFDLEGGTK